MAWSLPPNHPVANVLKLCLGQETKSYETLDKLFESTSDFLDDAYAEAVNIFARPDSFAYPKTPSAIKRKTRVRDISQENKENTGKKSNNEENEVVSKANNRQSRRTNAQKKKSSVLVPKEEKEKEAAPNIEIELKPRRMTRLQKKLQADGENFELIFTPPSTASKGRKIRQTAKRNTMKTNDDDILLSGVKKKIKQFEDKSKGSCLLAESVSPVKMAAIDREKYETPAKVFVSTLSQVTLSDKKLNMYARVICSPIEYEDKVEKNSSRRSSNKSLDKKRKSSIPKLRELRKSLAGLYCTKRHNRPSSHRSSVYVANLLKTISTGVKGDKSVEVDETDDDGDRESDSVEEMEDDTVAIESDDEEEDKIPKTPTPPQKKIRKFFGNKPSTSSQCLSQQKRYNSGSMDSFSKAKNLFSSAQKSLSASKRVFTTPGHLSRQSSISSERFVSPKVLEANLIRQKQEHLNKKEAKCRLILKTREQRLKQTIDEHKRLREKKMQRVLDRRHQQEEQRKMEQLARSASKDKPRERVTRTPNKTSERLREKAVKMEERRSKDEEIRKIKLQEKEEERLRFQEQLQKKKEIELLKQQERLAEQRRLQLQRQETKEREEKRLAEVEKQRLKEEEEKKKKEVEHQKLKELERQAAEIKKQRERERIAREEVELQKLQEREKLTREKLAQEKEPIKKGGIENKLNATFTNPNPTNTDCYDMTPEVIKPIPLKDPNNYDIADLHSEDSTDDESHPRKHIPEWARSHVLCHAVRQQCRQLSNLDLLFPTFEPPDLQLIFAKKRSRFFKRTSSADWSSPVCRFNSHNRSGRLST